MFTRLDPLAGPCLSSTVACEAQVDQSPVDQPKFGRGPRFAEHLTQVGSKPRCEERENVRLGRKEQVVGTL